MPNENLQQIDTRDFPLFSQEERKLLIHKIIEKRKESRRKKTTTEPSDVASVSIIAPEEDSISVTNEQQLILEGMTSNSEQSEKRRSKSTGSISRKIRGSSHSRNTTPTSSRSYDQNLNNEFTFKPNVKPLPDFYRSSKQSDLSFYDRVIRWQLDKEFENFKKKKEEDQSKLSDCTFQPRINRNSQIAMAELRGTSQQVEDLHERLYRNNDMLLEQRAKLLERELRRERREEQLECTFQPHLSTDQNRFTDVVPRYYRNNYRPKTSPETTSSSNKQLTFSPAVKGIKPHMSAAKQYVKTDVVERLTQPRTFELLLPPPPRSLSRSRRNSARSNSSSRKGITNDPNEGVMDTSTFLESIRNGDDVPYDESLDTSRSQLTTSSRRSLTFNQRLSIIMNKKRSHNNSAGQRNSRNSQQDYSSKRQDEDSQRKLELFLSRMDQSEIRKSRRVQEIARSTTPTFRPTFIAPHTKRILLGRFSEGDFIDRMNRYLLRRQETDRRHTIQSFNSKDLTFHPAITKRSERLKARSAYELSKGDMVRKESHTKLLKQKIEQEQLSDLTFHPSLTKKALHTQSVLKISQDPSYHLTWRQSKLAAKEKARKSEIAKRQQDEIQDCTFTPEILDCPDYIRRIARSMSFIKSSRANLEKPKPDWK